MKLITKIGITIATYFTASNFVFAALVVTPNTNANDLAANILGSGININPGSQSYIGEALTGGGVQAGTFTGGDSIGLGFDSGIILSTGNVLDAPNSNLTVASTGGNSAGDGQLGALSSGDILNPDPTSNASILEFNFNSTGGTLFFNYVFASEEYPEFVGDDFNDVFGFFLDGINIATLPNTDIDIVSVNNINSTTNSNFFRPNSNAEFDIVYDGLTVVLTAVALDLGVGNHNIRLGIADVGDDIIDSVVLIQSMSFSDTPLPIPIPFSFLLFATGLIGLLGFQKRIA